MSAFESLFLKVGIAASQLLDVKADTKKAVARFVMRALQSGNVDEYLQKRLTWLEAHEDDYDAPKRPVKVTAEFVDDTTGGSRSRRK